MPTLPPNSTSGLYEIDANAIPIGNDVNANNINATGNVTVGGYIIANGSITTNSNFVGNLVGNVTGNITLAGSNTQVVFNDSGATAGSNAFTFNKTSNTVTIDGTLTTTGNVTGAYFLGNGSQLTGLPATYTDANVVTLLASFGSNTISTSGNITGGYILGNGSQLTGLPQQYGNANVAAYLASGADTQDIITSGTVQGNRLQTPGAGGNIVGANYISANFYLGDGGLLSNVSSSYGNANVAAYLPTYTGNLNPGNVTATGNISGAYILGNGSQLTGLPASYGNANVAAYLPTYTGNLSPGNLSVTGNTTIGNITVSASRVIDMGLNKITNVGTPVANTDAATKAYVDSQSASGFTIQDDTANTTVVSGGDTLQLLGTANEVTVSITGTDQVTFGLPDDITVTGNLTANYFLGNGSQLTGLPASYGNANVAAYLPTYTGNIGAGNITATGNIEAGNLITNNKLLFGTDTPEEYIYADNLTMSFVTNNNTRLAVTSGNAVVYEPLWVTTGNITAASGNVVASGGVFGATGTFTGNVTAGNVSATNITGTYLIGDGSNITGVVAGSSSTQFSVKNTSGGSLAKGTPVYATGSVGASTTLEVSASRADTTSTMPSIGLLTSTLGVGATGYAISVGTLTQVDTSAYTAGQELYIGATGGITGTRPTGTNLVQPIGSVGRVDATTGSIETNIWNYYQLPNLGNGNVWVGNATGFPTEQVAYGNANVANYLPTYTGNLAGGNLAITANITGGNISTTGIFTASNITANLQVANLLVNNQQIQTTQARNPAVVSSTVADPGRIVIGTGYNGNLSPALDINSAGRGARLLVADSVLTGETQQRTQAIVSQFYASATANITNSNTRAVATNSQLLVGGGASGNTWGVNSPVTVAAAVSATVIGGGTGVLSAMGNTTVTAASGAFNIVQVNPNSVARSAFGIVGGTQPLGGNIGNAIGVGSAFLYTSGSYTGNVYAFYNPGTVSDFGIANNNNARSAPNYYFLRNDDDVAQNKLGSLRLFHEYRYDTATTGNITVDKLNGQCQQIAPTGNVTIDGYSNFVTSASDSVNTDYQFDTVTLVIKQGATPYTITMPTGANYKYAAGTSTLTSSANGVTMISITAYDDAGTTKYLTTISPEFT